MNITEHIINKEKSYKAKDIKCWCEKHKDDVENDFFYDADRLYDKYWNELFENDYDINPKQYYFVKRHTSYYGLNSWELIKDIGK